jgi:hypothetical protein
VAGEILLVLERISELSIRGESAGGVCDFFFCRTALADGAVHDDSFDLCEEAKGCGIFAGARPSAPLAAGVLVFAGKQSFADFGVGVAAGEQAEAVVGLGEGCVAAAGERVSMAKVQEWSDLLNAVCVLLFIGVELEH